MGSVARSLQIADPSLPWRSMPSWLSFFFRLGGQVATAHESGTTTAAVVIPPVRAFASVFAATGAAVGVATTSQAVPDFETHFSALSTLDIGTRLVVKMGERIYSAQFSGVVERSGNQYLKIEYDGMTHYLPKQECYRAQVGQGGKRVLPKRAQRSDGETSAVIEGLLGDFASDFLSIPTVDAVLVGQVSLMEQEISRVRIRAAGRTEATATLGALLRPSRFLPDGGISRSLLVSDRTSEFAMPVKDTPHVAVFDGPRALARYRSRFPRSSWVAVLDRCSTSYREGVDVANEEFAVRRGPAPDFTDLEIPPGTELQAFERR